MLMWLVGISTWRGNNPPVSTCNWNLCLEPCWPGSWSHPAPESQSLPVSSWNVSRSLEISDHFPRDQVWVLLLFVCFPFIFFNLDYWFTLLYNIVLVLPYIDLNPPWVYMCSSSWTPLPTPSPSHPSGSSQCTSPEHPVSCIEPGLAICFTLIIYIFQSHSPISSRTRPLPQNPKDCSIHLCLSCCLVYRVVVTVFLNSIYMS